MLLVDVTNLEFAEPQSFSLLTFSCPSTPEALSVLDSIDLSERQLCEDVSYTAFAVQVIIDDCSCGTAPVASAAASQLVVGGLDLLHVLTSALCVLTAFIM